jgi:hypothetical protein
MTVSGRSPLTPLAEARLQAGLLAFAAIDLGLALFMAVAPHAFYRAIGPFGQRNDHYVRDIATFYGAIGVALALAASRPGWRAPALAVSTIQFALHSLNHLLDIARAHPVWVGYVDFFSLLTGTAMLAWLWRVAAMAERSTREPAGPTSHPTPQRSLT